MFTKLLCIETRTPSHSIDSSLLLQSNCQLLIRNRKYLIVLQLQCNHATGTVVMMHHFFQLIARAIDIEIRLAGQPHRLLCSATGSNRSFLTLRGIVDRDIDTAMSSARNLDLEPVHSLTITIDFSGRGGTGSASINRLCRRQRKFRARGGNILDACKDKAQCAAQHSARHAH